MSVALSDLAIVRSPMGLEENLAKEQVDHLPTREAIMLEPDTMLSTAVEKMREKHIGCAVIVDQEKKPVGIFTERSLIDALVKDKSLSETTVGDFRDPEWMKVKTTDPISVVLDAVQRDELRFVCVTDESGKLTGITGQRGLSEYVSEYFPQQVMVQRLGGKPSMQTREGA